MPSNTDLPPDPTRCAKCHGPFTEKNQPQSPFPDGARFHAQGQCLTYCTLCGWQTPNAAGGHICPWPRSPVIYSSPPVTEKMLRDSENRLLRAVAAMLVNQERRLRLTQDLSMMQTETEEEYAARLLEAGRKALEEPR